MTFDVYICEWRKDESKGQMEFDPPPVPGDVVYIGDSRFTVTRREIGPQPPRLMLETERKAGFQLA